MRKFCGHCGTPITENEKFCPTCGTPLHPGHEEDALPIDVNSTNSINISKQAKRTILGSVIILLIICAGGIAYYWMHISSLKLPMSTEVKNTTTETTNAKTLQSQDPITMIQQKFKAKGIIGTVVATSYEHNPSGCLTLIGGKGYRLVVWDIKNDRIGYVSFTPNLYNFIERQHGRVLDPVLFSITLEEDTHDRDSQAGAWAGNTHTIPIFATYTLDMNGNVTPGKLTTGVGTKPSHLQGYLYEQKNVDMANLVLTEMSALHESADAHNLKL